MKMKNIWGALALALVLGIGSGSAVAGDAAAAEKAIAAAQAAQKKADSVDGEWRDTGKLIKQAQAALKAGEHDKAIKLAKQAEQQGKSGYEQAVSQKELRMPSFFK